jgi:hypothetical protein
MGRWREVTKSVAALVGTTATALLGIYAQDSLVGQVLLPVSVVATVVGVWAATNTDPPPES